MTKGAGRPEVSFTMIIGPSRSQTLARVLTRAQAFASEFTEVAPHTYRAVFRLGTAPAPYRAFAYVAAVAKRWRAFSLDKGGRPIAPTHAWAMGLCAADELQHHRGCRHPFYGGVPGRCGCCPLFDKDRADREWEQEWPPPRVIVVDLGPKWVDRMTPPRDLTTLLVDDLIDDDGHPLDLPPGESTGSRRED